MLSTLTITTFIATTALVGLVTYLIVRRMESADDPTVEFFTGGRMLSWPVVAGSLLLTNISTEQLVGLNGSVFKDGNLVGVAWESMAAFAMIATALLFLPKYLASGFTTTTAFLERRFDRQTRQIVSGLFLFGYVSVLLPSVLYTGSLAFKTMFQLSFPLWTLVLFIGGIGSAYAIFGGLKAVAVSDTINGAGLLFAGISIPVLALSLLGEGSAMAGLSTLTSAQPEYLTPLATLDRRGEATSVPWPTLLTGMMFIQIFYWSTNQVVVQRALGAKSLAEGQKGVLFASLMKLVGPVMLCLPGIVALHLTTQLQVSVDLSALSEALQSSPASVGAELKAFAQGLVDSKQQLISLADAERLYPLELSFNDQIYPAIVNKVLPSWSLGLFAAVLMGAILSSFNSALNSASTLFCLEFYDDKLRRTEAGLDDHQRADRLVKVGQYFSIALAIVSMLIAPQLDQLKSIFEYLQKANGLFSVPIISIFLVGILSKKAPASGAKVAVALGMISYGLFTFVGEEGLHWLHGYAISFLVAVVTLMVSAQRAPRSEAEILADSALPPPPVDMTPWAYAKHASVVIFALTVVTYVGLYVISH